MEVLIAVDSSDAAATVLRAVAPWLRESRANAHVLTVIDPDEAHGQRRGAGPAEYQSETMPSDLSGGQLPGNSTSGPSMQPMAEDRGQALARVEEERRESLAKLAAEHLSGLPCQVHVTVGEDVPETIASFAGQVGANMIAIGTHGRTGLRRVLMGSVAEAVVRSSQVPVIVVREDMQIAAS